MSITMKKDAWKIKDPQTGNYRNSAILCTTLPEDAAEIVEDSAELLETQAAGIVSDAQDALDGIEAQKDTMIASIASVAGQGTDATLTQTGVAADAKATGDKLTEQSDRIIKLDAANVFGTNTLYPGYYADDEGFHSHNLLGRTDYFQIPPWCKRIAYLCRLTSGSAVYALSPAMVLYDSSKQNPRKITTGNADKNKIIYIDVQDGEEYVIFNYSVNAADVPIMYASFLDGEFDVVHDGISANEVEIGKTKRASNFKEITSTDFTRNGYINVNYQFQSDNSFRSTETILLGGQGRLYYSCKSVNNLTNFFFINGSNQVVDYYTGTAGTAEQISGYVDVPKDATGCVFSKFANDDAVFILSDFSETKLPKKWLAVGDSITAGETNSNISYTKYVSSSVGLDCIKEGHSGYSFSRLMQNFADYDTGNTADIITIFAGTNDFNASHGAGTENDTWTAQNETIWAVCNFAMPYLQNRYPTKSIIFFTPIQRHYTGSDPDVNTTMVDENDVTLRQYAEAFIAAGVKYGIPVIDLYSISGFGVTNMASMTNDGLHPNDIGQRRLAQIIGDAIKTYI